jgi:orotate phosphoribosyltransferase
MNPKEIAHSLLEVKAFIFSPQKPFTWASGIKSPCYCDNRLLLSYPKIREEIVDLFIERISELETQPDSIAGVATAGISWGAMIAQKMQLPFIYVRNSAKSHGRQNKIEGKINDGAKIVLIEDLISTGMSSLNAYDTLCEEGLRVISIGSIFHYGLNSANNNFSEKNVHNFSLCSVDDLLEQVNLSEQDLQSIKIFQSEN